MIDYAFPNLQHTIIRCECIRERPTHSVHRIRAGTQQFILKSFTYRPVKEIQVYALLDRLSVPTLPVVQRGDDFLLMEDLQTSAMWRLAHTEDTQRAEVGRAVAEWYRFLHQAGREQAEIGWPDYLHCWINPLVEPALRAAGCKLNLDGSRVWQDALSHLEEWKAIYRSFPQTFNYSDFADENLALARESVQPLKALVFDYDVFATGTVFSDVRNVLSGLTGLAKDAFCEAYGPVDQQEALVDTPLSLLEGILIAAQRERIPAWARPLIAHYQNG